MCTNLFNVEGKPLKFYLETFKCFGILIKDHGGIIVDEPDNDTYTLTDPNLQIKQEQQVERYHIEFAVESIHLGRLLDIRKFRISDIDSKNQDGKMNNTIVKSEPNIQQSTLVSDNNEKLKNNVVSIQQTSPETSTTKRKLRSNLKEIEKKLPRLIKQRKKRTNKNNKDLLNLNKQTNQVTNKIIEQIDKIIKNETDNNSSENSSTDKPINHENKLPNNLSSKLPKELPNEILNDEKSVLISETINGDKKIIYVDDDDSDSGSESIILMESFECDDKFNEDVFKTENSVDEDEANNCVDKTINDPFGNKENNDDTVNDPLWNGKRSRITNNGDIEYKSLEDSDYRDPKQFHQDLMGIGKPIKKFEQDAMIDYLIKSNRILSATSTSAWTTMQESEQLLRYRHVESLKLHLIKKILPRIDDWELPPDIHNQFVNLYQMTKKRKKHQKYSHLS